MTTISRAFLASLERLAANTASGCGSGNAVWGISPAMLRIAAEMERIFQLPMPEAPGLCLVGGVVDAAAFDGVATSRTASVTGTGPDLLQAAGSCISEAVEFLSQWAPPDREFAAATPAQIAHGWDSSAIDQLLALFPVEAPSGAPRLRWAKGTLLARGSPVLLPASLCYRNVRDPGVPGPAIKLSSGCGAGQTIEQALLHALLELVERDAIALWWLGGRAGRRLLPDDGLPPDLQCELQRAGSSRVSWLLDITTDLGVPCVVALSTDAKGRGLACGFAARLAYPDAIRAAVFEMCQMEVGISLLLLKRRQLGDGALNDMDRLYLRRAFGFDVRGCPLLFPERTMPDCALPSSDDSVPLDALSRRLADAGVEAAWVDLTRPDLAIPAVRALAPGLQPYPSGLVLPRLERQIERTGNGFGRATGIRLM